MPDNFSHQPTLLDVGRRAGVSRATVSAALLGKSDVSAKTRARIVEVARKMGYAPNVFAAALATRGKRKPAHTKVAIVTHFRSGKSFEDFPTSNVQAMQERLSELGHESDFYDVGELKISCAKLEKMLYHRGYNGIVFEQLETGEEEIAATNWEAFSLVAWARFERGPACDFIYSNCFESILITWDEIHKAGYGDIGFLLCRNAKMPRDDLEREGALTICQSRGCAPGEKVIPPYLGDLHDKAEIKKWYLKHRPKVVVGFNVYHYYVLREMGVRIPEEVKFTSLYIHAAGEMAGIYHCDDESRVKVAEHMDFLIRHKRRGYPALRWGMMIPLQWVSGVSLPMKPRCPRRS